jgi:hypothetical protein
VPDGRRTALYTAVRRLTVQTCGYARMVIVYRHVCTLTQGTDCRERRTDIHTVEAKRVREIGGMGVRMVRRQDATRPPPRHQVT